MEVSDVFKVMVETGNETQLWYDSWLGPDNLKAKYSSLFELESRKKCSVANRIFGPTISWNWKSRPSALGLKPAVRALTNDISGIRLGHGADHWRCKLTGDGSYIASSLRKAIDKHHINILGSSVQQWSKLVPIKVLSFIWRATQGRILVAVVLKTRGIKVNSMMCCSCIGHSESAYHVFIDCSFVSTIRNNIMSWYGVKFDQNSIRSTRDLLHVVATWGSYPKKMKRLVVICYGIYGGSGTNDCFKWRVYHRLTVLNALRLWSFFGVKTRAKM